MADEGNGLYVKATSPEAVRQHLEEVLQSDPFAGSDRLRRFLRYLVEQTLSGEGARLKEYTIGLDVFQRGPGYDPQVDSTVRVHAGKLRDKLREFYLTAGRDSTVRIELPRGSYQPTFQMKASGPPEPAAAPGVQAGPSGNVRPRESSFSESPHRPARAERARPRWKWVALPAGLAVCVAAAWPVYRMAARREAAGPGQRSIVVLPFRDMSAQKDQEYFCDGMTEEIISALSRIAGLQVVASTSAFSFKGRPQDVRTIAAQLNVNTVLEGSVRKSGRHVRITAQLVSAPNGYHLWSQTYDREMTDIFGIQDEIASSIASTLRISLKEGAPARSLRTNTANVEAYNLYLRGRHDWYSRTEAGLRTAAGYFEQAVKADPVYARAYAGLADVYVQLDGWEFARPDEAMPRAKEYANKALSLEPLLAEAYVSLGAIYLTYDWDPIAAGREYALAVALDPGYITGHWWYAAWLDGEGRKQEAESEWARALKIDPLSVAVLIDAAGWLDEVHGKPEEALSLCRKAIDLDPTQSLAHRCEASALESVGQRQAAIAAIERSVNLAPDYPAALSDLAEMRVRQGRRTEAVQILNRVLSMAQTRYVSAFVIARIYFVLGDDQSALRWMRRAREERSPRLGWYLMAGGKYKGFDYGSKFDRRFTELVLRTLSERQ